MRDRVIVAAFFLFLFLGPFDALSQSYPTVYVGLVSITPSNAAVLAGVDGGYFKQPAWMSNPWFWRDRPLLLRPCWPAKSS